MIKWKFLAAGAVIAGACGYILWRYVAPVEIVAVRENHFLLVKNFPYLKSRRIAWWEANKGMIKDRYGVPRSYGLLVVDFGDGYRTEPNEELLFSTDEVFCFSDMQTDKNCINRKPLLEIGFDRNEGVVYRSY